MVKNLMFKNFFEFNVYFNIFHSIQPIVMTSFSTEKNEWLCLSNLSSVESIVRKAGNKIYQNKVLFHFINKQKKVDFGISI